MPRPKILDNVIVDTILAAATTLFAQQGYHGTSMRLIARNTGVNMATISYHFGNKEGLYHAVFKNLAEKERSQYEGYLSHLPDPVFHDPDLFRKSYLDLLDLYIDYSTSSPVTFQLWRQYILDFPLDTRVITAEYDQPIFQMIVEMFERAADNKIISPKTPDLGMMVSVITSVVSRFCEKRFAERLSGEDFLGIEKVEDLRSFLVLYLDLMLGYQR
jgi:AcrR family transcriptional regulator